MTVDRLPLELKHYQAVYGFFEGTVATIILDEVAATGDHALRSDLIAQGCAGFEERYEPRLERELGLARDRLRAQFPVELLWGQADAGLARAVPSSSITAHNFLVVSPALLDLSDEALHFVLAHELAHVGYQHAMLRWIMNTVFPDRDRIPPYLANEHDVWSRCAELSADRAALHSVVADRPDRLDSALRAVEEVLALLPSGTEPSPEARLLCLRKPDAIAEVYESFLRRPEDTFGDQLARFLIAAGEVVGHSDGEYLTAERNYLLNRISRHMYAGSLRAHGEVDGGAWAAVVRSGGEIEREHPERTREAFLNLAILMVRDGRVTREEYDCLFLIGTTVLRLSPETIRSLLLRVFRSDYYQPFQE